MKPYSETREEYHARMDRVQAEIAEFEATGLLNPEAKQLMDRLPAVDTLTDPIKAIVTVGTAYNPVVVAIGAALRLAKDRRQAEGFCGLWNRKAEHAPFESNIRKLLRFKIFKRAVTLSPELTLNDLNRSMRWLYYQAKQCFDTASCFDSRA